MTAAGLDTAEIDLISTSGRRKTPRDSRPAPETVRERTNDNGVFGGSEMYGKYTVLDDMMNVARGFDRALGRAGTQPTTRPGFVPAVESYEKDRNLVLRVEIPGVDPKAVEVTVKDRRLTLRGEKKDDRAEAKENVFLREIHSGKFERAFVLPEDVNADAIEASYSNGVLEIAIPRAELPKPRRIEVLTEGTDSKKDEKAA